jgi:glycosyltransferase involved in cell wall biosynthesis
MMASIVIPAYKEDENIVRTINELTSTFGGSVEVFVVVDNAMDSTILAFNSMISLPNSYKVCVQNLGSGPANAIRFGLGLTNSNCVIVMMADGSDDIRIVPELVNLVNRGVAVACASRYMPGGQQVGGPRLKKLISKNVGRVLYLIAGVGTHDPTNSYKAYSKSFLSMVNVESRNGFEVGLELVSKARKLRLPIAEVPTIWLDRSHGTSRFQLLKWAPKYFRWFVNCFCFWKLPYRDGVKLT